MKLKPLVASMLLVGLSGTAFAAASANVQSQSDASQAKVDRMAAVLEQNQSGSFQEPCDWFNRIAISGQVNADGIWSNNFTPVLMNPAQEHGLSRLYLNNANLFVDAMVNDWTKAHIALFYGDNNSTTSFRPVGPTLDEAYVTIGNFERSPLYFRAGRQYVDFGDYTRYPMVESLTQLLSETRGTAATVGYVHPAGFSISAYVLDGIPSADDVKDLGGSVPVRVRNFGAKAGFAGSADALNYRASVSYIRNMADVNYVANVLRTNGYNSKTSGLAASLDFGYGPFDLGGRYVAALNRFSPLDVALPVVAPAAAEGAKPRAFDITAGYTFPVMAHQSRLGLSYQHSVDAASNQGKGIGSAGLPRDRYEANYTVNVSKWTDVGFDLYHDRGYTVANGGLGGNATTGIIRLGLKFA